MVRLTRLRIDRFRNVKPGTDLRFGPTFNVLLGRNATGKSTLLDLIAAVTNDDLSAYADEEEGFDLTWWLEEGNLSIELQAARKPVGVITLADGRREDREFDDTWTIRIRKAGREAGRLEVVGARGTWKPPDGAEERFDVRTGLSAAGPTWKALAAMSRDRPARLSVEPLSSVVPIFIGSREVGRFDEALSVLGAITRSSFQLMSSGVFGSGDWLPHDFIMAVVKRPVPDSLVVPFDGLGSLARLPSILGFTSAELRPRLSQKTQSATFYAGFDCLFRRSDGTQISLDLLSFGQKRLFSFLWYLAVRETRPVVADELLNGLHHEWIEVCFERLHDRQSFLATQHPLLLDHIPIESAEAVRTTFIRCSLETGPNGREQMAWRNFDEEEAERFFVAYETGIQHVSEVLRTEGLW
jgi:energy-coupling factor transporter ATP-binding protein EcfA2